MDAGPGGIAVLAYLAIATVPVTLLHELGHALVATRRLDTDVELSVGSAGRIAEARLGRINTRVNALQRPDRLGGSVMFDAGRATAHDVLWIALAGPFASLIGTVVAAWLFAHGPDSGAIHNLLWAMVLGGVFGVLNLVPLELEERRSGPRVRTDGRLALDALRVARALR